MHSSRLRSGGASAVTTCMSTPSRSADHAARIGDAAVAVERIADRQRMDDRAPLADRMAAAGGEHAADVGVLDRLARTATTLAE